MLTEIDDKENCAEILSPGFCLELLLVVDLEDDTSRQRLQDLLLLLTDRQAKNLQEVVGTLAKVVGEV